MGAHIHARAGEYLPYTILGVMVATVVVVRGVEGRPVAFFFPTVTMDFPPPSLSPPPLLHVYTAFLSTVVVRTREGCVCALVASACIGPTIFPRPATDNIYFNNIIITIIKI